MKKCSTCGSLKEKGEFYSDPRKKDGLYSHCKKCAIASSKRYVDKNKERVREYQYNIKRHNINHIYSSRYDKMCRRVNGYYRKKSSSEGKEILTREEFDKWCEDNQKVFDKIYKMWKDSDFATKYTPTIDRIDSSLGYVPSNMQWLSLAENSKKGP